MYDSPEEVAEAFLSSLTETVEGVEAEDGHNPGVVTEVEGSEGVGGRRLGKDGEGTGELRMPQPESFW